MPRPRTTRQKSAPGWPADTQLVGLTLQLQPYADSTLYPQYTIGLHAWLLDQVRQMNPELSAYLHDGESEKPFTISALQGVEIAPGGSPRVSGDRTYAWTITALSQPVVAWLADWLRQPPSEIELRGAPLKILDWGLTFGGWCEDGAWALAKYNSSGLLLILVPLWRRKRLSAAGRGKALLRV